MPTSRPTSSLVRGSDAALNRVQAGARYFFEPDELALESGREPASPAIRLALHRLVKRGRIVPVTRRPPGYLIVPPEHASFGAPPVTWWINDCLQRIDPNYYVALLSAARHWGSSHYARQDTQVMLSKPRPPLTPGRLRVVFFAKAPIVGTPTTIVRNDVAPWRVSTRAATLLDLMRHQTVVGGLEAIARIARDLSPDIAAGEMNAALDALGQVPTAQRLGFLLQYLQCDALAGEVFGWVSGRSDLAVHQPLELGTPIAEQTARDRRWSIRFDRASAAMLSELR
jgi:hypothetical protein